MISAALALAACGTCAGFALSPRAHSSAQRRAGIAPLRPAAWAQRVVESARVLPAHARPPHPLRSASEGGEDLARAIEDTLVDGAAQKRYRVVDAKLSHVVVMPISEDTGSRDIECKITKGCLFLSVAGERILDGEMWGEVLPDECYWEIDEYKDKTGKEPRCIIIRLKKRVAEDWPFVIRGDYDLDAADWANRKVVSRKDFTKDDVEAALQLIVSLLKPAGLAPSPAPAAQDEPATPPADPPLKTLPTAPGSDQMQRQWEQAVRDTKEEEWRDTADAMSRAFSDGRPADEIQELLSVTQAALQGGPGSIDVERAPVAGLVFLRHSVTDVAQGDGVDADLGRALTEDGRVLATSSRRWFSTLVRTERQPFGLAFSSSAGRCIETAYLMGAPKPVVLDGVYDGTMEEEARAAFRELGYAPLADYVKAGHGGMLRRYAERVVVELADALASEVQSQTEDGDAAYLGSVAIYGHSVFSAAVAMLVSQALRLSREHTNTIATMMHGECEGMLVTPHGTGYCNLDPSKLPQQIDMQTAKTLSAIYATLRETGKLQQ